MHKALAVYEISLGYCANPASPTLANSALKR